MADLVPILDLPDALDRVDGDKDLYFELVEMFLGDWPMSQSAMQGALSKADAKALREAAHAAKGVLGNISAKRAHAAAYALENLAKAGDLTQCGPLLSALSGEVESFRAEYQKVKNG